MSETHNMIEHAHLRIIHALQQHGTLTEAANALCLTQSALSHQIRHLENRLGARLWQREGRQLRLTRAGQLLLQTAEQVLPVLQQAERSLKACAEGRQGVLRIGVECYPCYDWLTSVVGQFLRHLPDVDIDIVNRFQFTGFEGLLNHHIDVLVTPDPVAHRQIVYEELAEYELMLLVAQDHPLASVKQLQPQMLAQQTLLSFPVPPKRLDILNRFLHPAGVQPQAIREIQSMDLMLQMVSLQRGVCVLPHWLANQQVKPLGLKALRIGRGGLHKQLLLALRKQDASIAYIERFIDIGRQVAANSFT